MPPSSSPTNRDFDFILKDASKPKKPSFFAGLPKPILFGLLGLVVIVVIAVAGSLLKSGGGSSDKLYSAITQANQIVSVSSSVGSQSKNIDTQNIAATTTEVLSSQKVQLVSLVNNATNKSVAAKLKTVPNPTIDAALKASLLNNTFDQTYLAYLKTSLNAYQQDLAEAYKASPTKSKPALSAAYSSTAVILTSPQLK